MSSWPRPRRASDTKGRFWRPLEALEPRIAPGCMLDVVGVAALGSLARLVSTENQAAALSSQAPVQADGLSADRIPGGGEGLVARQAPTTATPNGGSPRAAAVGPSTVLAAIRSADSTPGAAAGQQPAPALVDLLAEAPFAGWDADALERHAPRTNMQATPVRSGGYLGETTPARSVAGVPDSPWPGGGPPTSGRESLSESGFGELQGLAPAAAETNVPGATSNVDETATARGAEDVVAGELRVPRGLPYANQGEREQSLEPYAITYAGSSTREPATGFVASPAEYDPVRGVLFSYASFSTIVTDMVKELTEDPTKDDLAYVVVSSASQQASATTSFANAGADLSKVRFLIQQSNSVWIRDYGPHFITVDDSLAIVDSHYYPNRPLDNFIPTLVGDSDFEVPTYDMGLYYSGGNFQPGPNRSGFVTSLVTYHNTVTDGFNEDFIAELYHQYQGIDTLHILPQLPFSVDGTGHIDMWMYLVDEDTVVISQFSAGANATAIQITNNAADYMEGLGFEVFRTPAWNSGSTHFTYANAFRVNDRILVPVYGTALKPGGNPAYNDEDAAAMAVWQAAAGPGVEVIPIQCSQIIPSAGAIHCIVKQVPRYTGSAPAADIVSPAGGEVLSVGSPYTIEWSAIDTNNVDPAEIELSVSYDGGAYQHLATTSDAGSYVWTPQNRAASATLKLVARSADDDEIEVVSNSFSISAGRVTTYDFSSGAGLDKFAYGSQSSSWAAINANPQPVGAALSSGSYAALATSNATGGDADANRYVAPVPSPLSNESTHVFTFDIAPPLRNISQIDVLWEGYADYCSQVELYVWDRVAQNWGDAAGLTGNNRYMDSWAGNVDGQLTGSISTDLSRYVDPSGEIRFLVYADRTGTNPDTQHNAGQGIETVHDYMSVTVKQVDRGLGTLEPPITG